MMKISDKELQYWMEEFPELEQEDIIDMLEAMDLDDEADGKTPYRMFPDEEKDPFSNIIQNVFSNLNKRKRIDIDD